MVQVAIAMQTVASCMYIHLKWFCVMHFQQFPIKYVCTCRVQIILKTYCKVQ